MTSDSDGPPCIEPKTVELNAFVNVNVNVNVNVAIERTNIHVLFT